MLVPFIALVAVIAIIIYFVAFMGKRKAKDKPQGENELR